MKKRVLIIIGIILGISFLILIINTIIHLDDCCSCCAKEYAACNSGCCKCPGAILR